MTAKQRMIIRSRGEEKKTRASANIQAKETRKGQKRMKGIKEIPMYEIPVEIIFNFTLF